MKRSLLIIPFAVLAFVLFSSTGFSDANSYDSTTGEIIFTLNRGWNLIPLGASMYSHPDEHVNTCKDSIKAAYVYSPIQKQYLGSYYPRGIGNEIINVPENGEQILNSEKSSNFYHATEMLGGMWIYTTRYCEFEANIQTKSAYTNAQENLDTITMKKGWNFITISPFMLDHNFKDLFQSCDVVAANNWDDYNQEWTCTSSSQCAGIISESDANIYEAAVGKVYVFKVAEDCHLTLGGGGISPPPLPD